MADNNVKKGNTGALVAVFIFLLAVAVFFGFNSQKPAEPVSAPETATQAVTTPSPSVTETPAAAVEHPAEQPAVAAETTTPETSSAETPAAESEKPVDGNLLAAPSSMILDVPKIMEDRVLGNPNAPVTIIEYASMTCPHCAHFASNVLPEVKKQLIDTGKAKLIFRDFPLDTFALRTSMMARCAAPEKFYSLLEVLFKNQDRWTKSEDPIAAVTQLGTLAGMDEALIKQCMESAELEAYILRGVQEAQTKYNLKSTPSFVLNDGKEVLTGGHKVEDFVNAVNKLTAGQ